MIFDVELRRGNSEAIRKAADRAEDRRLQKMQGSQRSPVGDKTEAEVAYIADRAHLTSIVGKMRKGEPLKRYDIAFLYQHHKDPHIAEMLEQRDPMADLSVILDCKPEQIARKKADFKRPDIVAYVGDLFDGFFDVLPAHVDHVYKQFPDKPVTFKRIMIGGKTQTQLRDEITSAEVGGRKMQFDGFADGIFSKMKVKKEQQNTKLIIVSVTQLGFPNSATTQQVHEKARKLGLDLLPAEAGPHLRLQYKDQPVDERLAIGMEPIFDRGGDLRVFLVEHYEEELWLSGGRGSPGNLWASDVRFVFVRRKR